MPRPLNLRMVEAFKALVEAGTVSLAAKSLRVSQPAASKLLAQLEQDVGLQLFDRVRGRLVPNERGMRLYREVDRIFGGVRQIEQAVESIRRDEQGRLVVGVMPALAGSFVQRVTSTLLADRAGVHVSVMARSSEFIAGWLTTRQIDVGIVGTPVHNPAFVSEPLMRRPLVCILPREHPLGSRDVVRPEDLAGVPFISFAPSTQMRRQIDDALAAKGVTLNVVADASLVMTACEFVAAGLGVSLVHPLSANSVRGRVLVRRFEPEIPFAFLLCRARDTRNRNLVDLFVGKARTLAEEIDRELLASRQLEAFPLGVPFGMGVAA